MVPQIGMPQGWELILIVLVILLLFGARKLPELARGSGQALRIFKSETKGLKDGDSHEGTDTAQQSSEQRQVEGGTTSDTERVRQERTDGTSA